MYASCISGIVRVPAHSPPLGCQGGAGCQPVQPTISRCLCLPWSLFASRYSRCCGARARHRAESPDIAPPRDSRSWQAAAHGAEVRRFTLLLFARSLLCVLCLMWFLCLLWMLERTGVGQVKTGDLVHVAWTRIPWVASRSSRGATLFQEHGLSRLAALRRATAFVGMTIVATHNVLMSRCRREVGSGDSSSVRTKMGAPGLEM